jgi:glycosyltransferase involved in cell wall biosynthesis
MILGINASRARSGGARSHLIGILSEADPLDHGLSQVHVWSYPELLDALPDRAWLIKHCPVSVEQSILHQLSWERFVLPYELRSVDCSILFNVDAGTVCRFHPNVTMSRDMLSYEPGEIERYGWSRARFRLMLLRWVQNASLRQSDCAVFLTSYAAKVIQSDCGVCKRTALIPHGVGEAFKGIQPIRAWPAPGERPVECLYVSNAAPYKHQWHVVKAIEILRQRGHSLRLTLVGGGAGPAQARLTDQIAASDPDGEFVNQSPFVSHEELPAYLSGADLFVFASSCENMPNSLLEAMAASLPIACSDRGPMPEVLSDGGVYFNPEDPYSIALAIEKLTTDSRLRVQSALRAKQLSTDFSWKRTANDTFALIKEVARST